MSNSFGFGGINCSLIFARARVIEVFVAGIGLRGPGLADWRSAVPILAGTAPLGEAVAGAAAARHAGLERAPPCRHGGAARAGGRRRGERGGRALRAGATRSVFASANGDGAVVTAIVAALSGADPLVSPTQFHNSVHNAPAGYWSIGARSTRPTSSLGAHDASFAGGAAEGGGRGAGGERAGPALRL